MIDEKWHVDELSTSLHSVRGQTQDVVSTSCLLRVKGGLIKQNVLIGE